MTSVPYISPEEILERLVRVREYAERAGWHGVLVVGRSFYDRVGHLAYLTGHFPPFPASPVGAGRRGLGHGMALVPTSSEPILLVDGPYRAELVAITDVRRHMDLVQGLCHALEERRMAHGVLGLAGEDILPFSFQQALAELCPKLRLSSAERVVERMRSRKSAAEQALLRRAAEIAGLGLKAAVEAARPGATETQVCAAGTAAALEAGADFVRYLRVHTGPWSAWGSRWPQATGRVIESHDTVYLDIIGAYRGYQFDVLRTTVAGTVTPRQRDVFEAVHMALEAAVARARPGVPASAIMNQARDVLRDAGLGDHVTPFAGHGIGLETVEQPYLVDEESWPLEEAMVLCIEPKVAIADEFGCSIEQEVIVRPDGPEVISEFPTRLW